MSLSDPVIVALHLGAVPLIPGVRKPLPAEARLHDMRHTVATKRGEADVPESKMLALMSNMSRARPLDFSGERGGNRTFNLEIKSLLLCQLSYAPTSGNGA